jgi:hypothetical protein
LFLCFKRTLPNHFAKKIQNSRTDVYSILHAIPSRKSLKVFDVTILFPPSQQPAPSVRSPVRAQRRAPRAAARAKQLSRMPGNSSGSLTLAGSDHDQPTRN